MDGLISAVPLDQDYEDPHSVFPIIDPHHHLWDLQSHYYPWLSDEPVPVTVGGDSGPLRRDYLIGDYLSDSATEGVVGSVHVEANHDPSSPEVETAWIQQVASRWRIPSAHVAYAALQDPKVEDLLERYAASNITRGVRQILNFHSDPVLSFSPVNRLMDDSWLRGFSRLPKYDLSFDLQVYPEQLHHAAALAASHPSTVIVLNHAGMPYNRTKDGLNVWRSGMLRLASCENVFVKISGLGMVDHNWTVNSIRWFVRQTIDIFGVRRCMFASNFPVDGLYSTYSVLYRAFRDIVADVSPSERRMLFYGSAAHAYRLSPV